jgi:ketosteroid isomerase-like protein
MMIRIALLVYALLAPPELSAQRQDPSPPEGVRTVIKQFKATEITQGKGRAALFTDDALVFNAWDGRYEGRRAVDSLWNSLAQSGTFTSSKIEEKATTYRKLSDSIWLVDYQEVLTGQRGPKSGREFPPRNLHMTFIIARQKDDAWRIIYFRAADAREFAQRTRSQDSTDARH